MAPHTRFLTVPAQTRLRNWAATRRARRKHAKNLRGRPEPEARSPHPVEPDRQSRTPDPNHHQEGPPTSLRLRDQPRPRSDQQRLRAGAAPQRGLPQDHQWLSKRVGSQALRRHSLRRRNRTTTLDPRHRRHPPNPPRKTNPSPRLNQPTARVSNYRRTDPHWPPSKLSVNRFRGSVAIHVHAAGNRRVFGQAD